MVTEGEGNCATSCLTPSCASDENLPGTCSRSYSKDDSDFLQKLSTKGRKRKRKMSGREGSRDCVSCRKVFGAMPQRDFTPSFPCKILQEGDETLASGCFWSPSCSCFDLSVLGTDRPPFQTLWGQLNSHGKIFTQMGWGRSSLGRLVNVATRS